MSMADDDEGHVASVSSLRSRFEQMTSSKKQSPASGSQSQKPLKPSHTGVDPFVEPKVAFTPRASLDIPRDTFSSTGSASPRGAFSRDFGGGFHSATLPRNYSKPRQRPLSVNSTFSPPRAPPTFRVESPRSPPPRFLNSGTREPPPEHPKTISAPSPNSNYFKISGSPSYTQDSRNPPPPPPPPPPPVARTLRRPPPPVSSSEELNGDVRATTNDTSPERTPFGSGRTSQEYPGSSGSETEKPWPTQELARPPVPTRSNKPKIPGKPKVPARSTRPNVANTALAAPPASSEERISPFSTPPSSANNSPGRSDNESATPQQRQRQSLILPLNFNDPSLRHPVVESRNVDAGISLNKAFAPPPPPRAPREEVKPKMKFEDSVKGNRVSLDTPRPNLPPRPTHGIMGGIRARAPSLRGRSYSPPRPSVTANQPNVNAFLPPPQRAQPPIKARSSVNGFFSGRTAPSASSSSSGMKLAPTAPDYTADYGPDDSDDASPDDSSALSEYPDASQANRRRPHFKNGVHEISCRSDVRLFAVCGQYVCTTSNSTKVWNIETGQCIMSLSHGEGTRITAIAFKPSVKIEDEGRQLWLGTSHGELLEVDISRQAVIESRASAHTKKEVVKIHRCGYELWTLDEGGKLQVWPPDPSGVPNLRNSPTTFRIPNRHTYSLVIDRLLWIGAGKNVHVYQPSSDPSVPFNVLSRPMVPSKATGDITCGAVVNSTPDKVYFGHIDGKVSIYSKSKFVCLDVISISLYKINSMSGVGDHLWTGFKTGMIYVYDVRSKPWRALKDWQCSDGPIVEVVADRTSIWKVGRLQVVSLGVDNVIRIWDGMLEDDWLESEMHKRDEEFCGFREVKALVCTWNAGACKPQDLFVRDDDRVFLENVLRSVESPDIIVFGFQELVDLENKKLTAKTFLKGSKKKKAADQLEHMSHQYRLWQQQLTKSIETHMPRDEPYVLLHAANLVGLFTCVFVKASERGSIRNVSACTVKRGLGGLHGNKGALIVRFLLDDSSLCFINCHLAAGQSHTVSRNNDIAAILESNSLPPESSAAVRSDIFVGGGDGSMILDHEICVLNGDLNYRIDMHRDSVISKVRNQDLEALLDRDQLLTERKRNPGFRLRIFNEESITFSPTYKYDVGTDTYDTSEKKRSPAYCDRLLYRGLGKIKQTQYRRWEVRTSDHRPVSGAFTIRLKTVDRRKREIVWQQCVEKYREVQAKHVWEAKMDFLVNVCGYGIDEARSTLGEEDEMVDAVKSLQDQQQHY